jgi:hypothetical protein
VTARFTYLRHSIAGDAPMLELRAGRHLPLPAKTQDRS